jgi:hypothetical protein
LFGGEARGLRVFDLLVDEVRRVVGADANHVHRHRLADAGLACDGEDDHVVILIALVVIPEENTR